MAPFKDIASHYKTSKHKIFKIELLSPKLIGSYLSNVSLQLAQRREKNVIVIYQFFVLDYRRLKVIWYLYRLPGITYYSNDKTVRDQAVKLLAHRLEGAVAESLKDSP